MFCVMWFVTASSITEPIAESAIHHTWSRAGSGDETLPANLFDDTTYGDKFLYGIRRPPLLDPFKVADYMKQNPLAIQDIASANIALSVVACRCQS